MINAAIWFFVLAVIFGFLGATGIAGLSMEIGKILVVILLALSILSFIANVITGRKGGGPPV